MIRTDVLSEEKVYEILANPRRRETIRHLKTTTSRDTIPLRDLSETIAERETGESPPPRSVRESVYNSLHQTHLPQLEELGVVRYDRAAREVCLHQRARDLELYMEVVTKYGVTWSEIYRTLGVVSLTVVVATHADLSVVGAVEPLVWSIAFLGAFVAATAYQLWSNRWYIFQVLAQ